MNELVIPPSSVIGALNRSEIDGQIATARQFPRDLERFEATALKLATVTIEDAAECIYALPRDGKMIEGPSARFAEILAASYGNCRAGARIIEEAHEYVVAQGAFHDLESNVQTTFETRRGIIHGNGPKKGRRYSANMVITTCNAACSIALRQATLKGVPKPLWESIYQAARQRAAGAKEDIASAAQRAIAAFNVQEIDEPRILNALGIASREEMTPDHIAQLRGLYRAIQDGETTADEAFPKPVEKKASSPSTGSGGLGRPTTIEEFATMTPPSTSSGSTSSGSTSSGSTSSGSTSSDLPLSTQPKPPDVASAADAYNLGYEAYRKHASRLQWPANWRDQMNIEAWLAGWDAAATDAKGKSDEPDTE